MHAEPELRLAVATAIESTDLESGSTLVVRGEGFPVGPPCEVTFTGERRSYLHPGELSVALPAKAVSHDRVEVALDGPTMTTLLGSGDDDARLDGTVEVRFHTTGALVTTTRLTVNLRARAFPRNERVAAEKRARVEESLRGAGLSLGEGLVIARASPSVVRRGDVAEGDRLTELDGIPLANLDDAIPPAAVGIVQIATSSADGSDHHAKAFLGLQWIARVAACVGALLALTALVRRVRPVAARALPRITREAPEPSAVVATAGAALAFELMARFLRVRLDAPVALALLAILLFGPARRAIVLALAFGLASSAALVCGGVFRVDELNGALSPLALPGLLLVVSIWGQRFGGSRPTRAAYVGLLFAILPAVHVFAPRVGVMASVGRSAVATALVVLALPALQRGMTPVREVDSPAILGLSLVGALSTLACAIALGPFAGAVAAGVACVAVLVGAVVVASSSRSA